LSHLLIVTEDSGTSLQGDTLRPYSFFSQHHYFGVTDSSLHTAWLLVIPIYIKIINSRCSSSELCKTNQK